ncbi:MAG: hypothetical protein NZV14_15725 [Bryobacteraceae bacterium]|nr:hypothetical protein [Bryobacteraceae bacterium]MDW8379610.1 hypothetical protein [Bryobacterales bacterium]
MKHRTRLTLASFGLAITCTAVETKFWQHYEATDYEKATLQKVAVRSDGRLSLAPVFRQIFDASTAYLWAVAEDSKGNVYVGGGAPSATVAKLFQVDPAGNSKLVAELPGLEIHAIAIDPKDRVYAATSPDGKVYRIAGSGKAEVFYDPKAKYIWAMAFNRQGELFVATGDQGEVHRVDTSGQGRVFFVCDESHARSLTLDRHENLIVGTEPGGLVIRVSPAGEGFVLYQSSKREITAVAVAPDGSIYAAGVGNKAPATLPAVAPQPAPTPIPVNPPVGQTPTPVSRPAAAAPPTLAPAPTISGGSEVYRIDSEGSPRRVWQNANDLVYSIGIDSSGMPLIATGNRGRIYRLDSDRLSTLLVSATSAQITGLALSKNGGAHVITGNIGKLYRMGPELEREGVLESEALDAGGFSYWGRIRLEGEIRGGSLLVETRSGNLDRPQRNWSAWATASLNSFVGRVASPAARFLQYRLKLTASSDGQSPEVSLIEIAYLMKNVAPVIEAIEATPANYRFPASSPALASSSTLTLPPIGQRPRGSAVSVDSSSTTMNYAKGYVGARWKAYDDNGDPLVFKLEIRGAGERDWKLLKNELKERHYSWDSTAFADGEYQLRITASDAPGNPPGQALTTQLESDRFLIDNTPPVITGLTASIERGKIIVRWKAKDARSVIEKAEYSMNGGEWLVAQPTGRLSDSLELDFVLELDRQGQGETTIAVRVTDEFENQTVDKVTIR